MGMLLYFIEIYYDTWNSHTDTWNLHVDIYNMFCAILTHYLTQILFIFLVNSILYDHLIADETIIWFFSYIKDAYVFILEKLILFCFWATF